ncbi:MAG: MBOAT family O-acyltransferase [Alphaproteobacteria bacterium]
MIFNEFRFVFFLAAVVALFFALPRSARVYVLLGASWLFYGLSGVDHLAVLVGGVVWVYLLTRSDELRDRPWQLALAIAGPVAALFYYKYADFVIGSVLPASAQSEEVFSLFQDIVLPAGISFFTFQLVSYAVDRYTARIAQPARLPDFALYISFFPQLVAGPILRFDQVQKSLATLKAYVPNHARLAEAAGYICFGLAAKVLIADTLDAQLAPLVESPGELSGSAAVYVILGYSFQIYFDFYGYSMVAIGLGKIFGFDFPANFNRPYSAANPRDFWRRWHITLSYWIRDYLYLPLGGNRHYLRNIAIVFAIAGLWHGAGWTFIVWGLYHAALVIGYHLSARWWDRLPMRAQQTANFTLVSIGWLLFLFSWTDLAHFGSSIANAFGGAGGLGTTLEMWLVVAIAALVCFGVRFERLIHADPRSLLRTASYSAGLGVLLVATFLFIDRSQTFIYFRF